MTPPNGAQALWQTLAAHGVGTVFGYPGGAIMPVYDALTLFPTSGTSWHGTSRARFTRQKGGPRRRANSASVWRPAGRGPPTSSPGWPTR